MGDNWDIIKVMFGMSTKNKITTENRIKDIQKDIKHIKGRLDIMAYYFQKINKDGLKVKVAK